MQHGFIFVTCFDCIITIRIGFFPIDICYKEIKKSKLLYPSFGSRGIHFAAEITIKVFLSISTWSVVLTRSPRPEMERICNIKWFLTVGL